MYSHLLLKTQEVQQHSPWAKRAGAAALTMLGVLSRLAGTWRPLASHSGSFID